MDPPQHGRRTLVDGEMRNASPVRTVALLPWRCVCAFFLKSGVSRKNSETAWAPELDLCANSFLFSEYNFRPCYPPFMQASRPTANRGSSSSRLRWRCGCAVQRQRLMSNLRHRARAWMEWRPELSRLRRSLSSPNDAHRWLSQIRLCQLRRKTSDARSGCVGIRIPKLLYFATDARRALQAMAKAAPDTRANRESPALHSFWRAVESPSTRLIQPPPRRWNHSFAQFSVHRARRFSFAWASP